MLFIKKKHDAKGIVLLFENGAVKEKTILRLGTKLHKNDVTDEMYLLMIE